MSLLRTIKAQLGLSNTPANNFHLDASADDGTLKLRRGNADAPTQDILTVDAAGAVSGNLGLGANQTWQVVTGSRAVATDYTNTTGRPIQLHIVATGNANATAEIVIGGVTLGRFLANSNSSNIDGVCSAIVPAGAVYRVNVSGATIRSWAELR